MSCLITKMKVVAVACFWWLILLITTSSGTNMEPCLFSSLDYQTLQDLYSSTSGSISWKWAANYTQKGIPWDFSSSLSSTSNPCVSRWQYVACSYNSTGSGDTICYVKTLLLQNINMQGRLPLSIGNFERIESLNTDYNRGLIGTIPLTVGSLGITCKELILSQCSLTGTIPQSITNLTSLEILNLGHNHITGSFPIGIAKLTKLKTLDCQYNRLYGTLPIEISQLSSLKSLTLQDNLLYGTLPPQLGELHNLTNLYLTMNDFTGTIPSTLSNLFQLKNLYLFSNKLSGTIPKGLSNGLQKLEIFSLVENDLTGTIPDDFGNFTKLQRLYLARNRLSGTLPISLTGCISMTQLDLYENHFTGMIPKEILSMKLVKTWYFFNNYFTGTISPWISNGTSLANLYASDNFLSGTLPSTLFHLSLVSTFDISNNRISGTIPSTISNWKVLRAFKIGNNMFSGTIPTTISMLSNVALWQCSFNMFTGNFPIDIMAKAMRKMQILTIQSNLFTGYDPLPSNSTSNSAIVDSPYSWTRANFTLWKSIRQMNNSKNLFSGPLPTSQSITGMKSLQIVDFTNNVFSGSLTNKFTHIPNLIQLLLGGNRFTGTLDNIVNPALQHYLFTIDLTDNQLTGSLVDDLFALPLTELAIAKNCLQNNNIPMSICNLNQSLRTLALDGMYSSEACVVPLLGNKGSSNGKKSSSDQFFGKIFPEWSSQSYQLPVSFSSDHSIPSCLFNFTHLSTLHLSGNGLKGALPSTININSSLQTLILSHNMLTGTIPVSFQEKQWKTLDLSFNKFTGSLDSDHMYNYSASSASTCNAEKEESSLSLSINRLSGEMPHVLHDACSIDVLTGNMFTCNTFDKKRSLPSHDQHRRSYECGSNNVNTAIYTLLVLIVTVAVLIIAYHWRQYWLPFLSTKSVPLVLEDPNCDDRLNITTEQESNYPARWKDYWYLLYKYRSPGRPVNNESADMPSSNLAYLAVMFWQLRRWISGITLFLLIVAIPVYSSLSAYCSTYKYAYAWTLSMAFKSGVTATVIGTLVVLIIAWVAFTVNFPWSSKNNISATGKDASSDAANDDDDVDTKEERTQKRNPPKIHWSLMVLFLANVVIVLIVNMVYVYASEASRLSSQAKQVLVMLVSLYKVLWNHALLWLKEKMHNRALLPDASLTSRRSSITGQASAASKAITEISAVTLTYLSFFNNIVAPCIAVALVSPECFYYAYNTASPVTTSYSVPGCEISATGLSCNGAPLSVTTSYTPPFTYSYQCSSALLSSFADVFVYRYIFGSIVATSMKILLKLVQNHYFSYYYQQPKETRRTFGWWMYYYSTMLQPAFARPLHRTTDTADSLLLAVEVPVDIQLDRISTVSNPSSDLPVLKNKKGAVSRIEAEMMIIVTDVSILLAFGVLFPPLAVIGWFSICLHTMYLHFFFGRLLYFAFSDAQRIPNISPILVSLLNAVEKECRVVPVFLRQSLSSLPALVMLVWSFFLFDTLGDATGFDKAVWILVIMAIMAVAVHMLSGDRCLSLSSVFGASNLYFMFSREIKKEEGLSMQEVRRRDDEHEELE